MPDVGDVIRLTVGPVAHGGHFVGRLEGQVVFVRHGLPGEDVARGRSPTSVRRAATCAPTFVRWRRPHPSVSLLRANTPANVAVATSSMSTWRFSVS